MYYCGAKYWDKGKRNEQKKEQIQAEINNIASLNLYVGYSSHWKKAPNLWNKAFSSTFAQNVKNKAAFLWYELRLFPYNGLMLCFVLSLIPGRNRNGWVCIIFIWLDGVVYINNVDCKKKIWLFQLLCWRIC